MPLPEEAVEDATTPAEHRTLYLVDVRTPVLGLGRRRQGLSEGLPPPPRVERRVGGHPTLQKVILQWQELSCVFRISTSP